MHTLEKLLREGRDEFQAGRRRQGQPHRPPRPDKSEGGRPLVIKSELAPKGDQPQAIADLVEGVRRNDQQQGAARRHRLGQDVHHGQGHRGDAVPGARPRPQQDAGGAALRRVQDLFPDNAVEYFVSYYDYYQPEAYVPRTDTYIEKESSINEQIDRMRHAATRAMLDATM